MRAFSRAKDIPLPWSAFEEALAPALEALIAKATAAAIAAAIADDLEFDEDEIDDAMVKMTPKYVATWSDEVMATTKLRAAAAIAAYEAGEISREALLARVDLLFDAARAEAFAVTETTRIFDVVGRVINAAAGVERVRFDTVRDPFVCPICDTFDNEVYDVDDAPEPPLHVNCRCYLAPVRADLPIPEAVA